MDNLEAFEYENFHVMIVALEISVCLTFLIQQKNFSPHNWETRNFGHILSSEFLYPYWIVGIQN